MSVTTATQGPTAAHHETRRETARRPASPGMPRPRGISAGGGRCWVRTNVGLADGFADIHRHALDLRKCICRTIFPHILRQLYARYGAAIPIPISDVNWQAVLRSDTRAAERVIDAVIGGFRLVVDAVG